MSAKEYLCKATAVIDGELVEKQIIVTEWWHNGKLGEISIEDSARGRFYDDDLFDKCGLESLTCKEIDA